MLFRLMLGLLIAMSPVMAGIRAAHADPPGPPVLIIYDSWQQLPNPTKANIEAPDISLALALQIEELLGHFPFSAKLVRLTDYQTGMISSYPHAFFAGNLKNAVLPKAFLRDVQHYRGSLYWINHGLDQLDSSFLKALGISYQRLETEPGYTRVRYHDVTLEKGDPTTNVIRVTAPEHCHILAMALTDKGTEVPYMVRSGHFWYVADSPLAYASDHDRYFAFADTLYDFFGVQPKARKRAFLRIEDINVTDDQTALRGIADRLYRLHIPFMMAVIPRYQDLTSAEMDHTGITLMGEPGFASTLQYMTAHGGSVVMHGWNHRYRGVSAIDSEFWDNNAKGRRSTRPDDSVTLVETHLRNGLKDCFAAHIYPIAWETPHYDASMLDYSVIARHFSTAVEQRGLLNTPDFAQFFPFVIRRDIYGQQIFPESLGYIEKQMIDEKKEDLAKERQEVDAILSTAKNLRVLRDVTVGAFVHPFLDPNIIIRLAQGLRDEGYTFIDLREEENTVQLDDMLIATQSVDSRIYLHQQYLHEFYIDEKGRTRREHCSTRKITGTVKRALTIPAGWIYVCRGERNH